MRPKTVDEIERLIDLENLILWHGKVENIKWLWEEFGNIIK